MGNCCNSKDTTHASREITRNLLKQKHADRRIIKLLFLGAGGSGKSTLFKQLKSIHV